MPVRCGGVGQPQHSAHGEGREDEVRAGELLGAKEKILVKNKTKPKAVALRIKSYVANTHPGLIHIGN